MDSEPTTGRKSVRCFLRHIETGKFFKAPEEWTENLADALPFTHAYHALKIAQDLDWDRLELVFTNNKGDVFFGTLLSPPSKQINTSEV